MWQEPMMGYLTQSPKHEVSNFNPYEVLEPQKVNLKENILVDLTPDETTTADAKLEMGSFLDTVTKTDYNLVDLFENIYVTPQHLRKTSMQLDKDTLIDFGNFFDKLEDEIVEKSGAMAETLDKSDLTSFNELIYQSAINPATNSASMSLPNNSKQCEENEIQINTVKINKCKETHDSPEKSEHALHYDLKSLTLKTDDYNQPMKPENTKANTKLHSSEYRTDFDYMNIIKQPKDHSEIISHDNNVGYCPNMKSDLSHNMRRNILDEVKREGIPIKCKCYYASNILNINKSMDASFINPFDNDIPVNHSKDLKKPKAINMLLNNQFTQIKTGQLLQTIVKDQKLYAKQKKVNENNQNLTKGPNIYEKSIILPQIMERLAARKKILDDQRNWKRRLVLDSKVSKCNEDLDTGKSVVLMADCNKERLANLKVRTLFDNFIKTGIPQ